MRTYTSQTLNYNDNVYVGPFGTLTVDYDLLLRVHDNVTPGGHVFNPYGDSNVAVYLAGNVVIGNATIDGNTPSTSDTTGAIVITGEGGIGVGGNINIGGNFYASGPVTTPLVSISNGIAQFEAEQTSDTTTSQTVVDSFPTTLYRSVHYFAQVTDLDNSLYHTTSITVVQDGSNAYKSEYNVVAPEGRLGNFNANVSAGSCTLSFTAFNATNKVVNILRTGISV